MKKVAKELIHKNTSEIIDVIIDHEDNKMKQEIIRRNFSNGDMNIEIIILKTQKEKKD